MDCVALGDSIAVGISQVSSCRKNAIVGVSSGKIATMSHNVSSDIVVISAGSNDPMNASLRDNLLKIRNNVKAKKIVWIAPYNARASSVVRDIARLYGDGIVQLSSFSTKDGLHPSNYRDLAREVLTRKIM